MTPEDIKEIEKSIANFEVGKWKVETGTGTLFPSIAYFVKICKELVEDLKDDERRFNIDKSMVIGNRRITYSPEEVKLALSIFSDGNSTLALDYIQKLENKLEDDKKVLNKAIDFIIQGLAEHEGCPNQNEHTCDKNSWCDWRDWEDLTDDEQCKIECDDGEDFIPDGLCSMNAEICWNKYFRRGKYKFCDGCSEKFLDKKLHYYYDEVSLYCEKCTELALKADDHIREELRIKNFNKNNLCEDCGRILSTTSECECKHPFIKD